MLKICLEISLEYVLNKIKKKITIIKQLKRDYNEKGNY